MTKKKTVINYNTIINDTIFSFCKMEKCLLFIVDPEKQMRQKSMISFNQRRENNILYLRNVKNKNGKNWLNNHSLLSPINKYLIYDMTILLCFALLLQNSSQIKAHWHLLLELWSWCTLLFYCLHLTHEKLKKYDSIIFSFFVQSVITSFHLKNAHVPIFSDKWRTFLICSCRQSHSDKIIWMETCVTKI